MKVEFTPEVGMKVKGPEGSDFVIIALDRLKQQAWVMPFELWIDPYEDGGTEFTKKVKEYQAKQFKTPGVPFAELKLA